MNKLVKYNYAQVVDEVIENANLLNKICLDCTCGRGNDSLKLIKSVGQDGFLYCCDIQEEAALETEDRLSKEGYSNYKIFNKSHDEIFEDIDKNLDFVIYNLGYLPKSDKKIVTKPETTISSIKQAMDRLSSDGIILVVSYLGHEGSFEERSAVDDFFKTTDQKKYAVEKIEFYNQVNNPPVIYILGVRN